MKPSIREIPIQTCGVRSDGGVELKVLLSLPRMWISLEEVGVAGGGSFASAVASEGITGPGTLKGFGSGTSSLLEKKLLLENWRMPRCS